MPVSDNTIVAKGLKEFFETFGKKGLNVSQKVAKSVLKIPGRTLGSLSPKAALSSLPEVINFYHTGKGLYLGKFV